MVCVGDEMRPYCQAMGGKREVGGLKREVGDLQKAKERGALPKYAAYICRQAWHGTMVDSNFHYSVEARIHKVSAQRECVWSRL